MTAKDPKDEEPEKKVNGKEVKKLLKNALFMGANDEKEKELMKGWVDKIFSDPLEKEKSKS
jgi:hypothetical protein